MKYMGSKRAMLQNGLGHLIHEQASDAKRFVDLFAGSAAVAIYVASRIDIPVLACDLQRYSVVLAESVITRNRSFDSGSSWDTWFSRADVIFRRNSPPTADKLTRARVAEFRAWCESREDLPITKTYGGHYFSPVQAVWLDALRAELPQQCPATTIALGALIQAASRCAAAPGHTAQPFQPTRTAKPFLQEAWA